MTRSSFIPHPSSLGAQGEQRALPLPDSRITDPLFLAYSRTRLAELGITFEKARSTRHLRLPLERVAAALRRDREA